MEVQESIAQHHMAKLLEEREQLIRNKKVLEVQFLISYLAQGGSGISLKCNNSYQHKDGNQKNLGIYFWAKCSQEYLCTSKQSLKNIARHSNSWLSQRKDITLASDGSKSNFNVYFLPKQAILNFVSNLQFKQVD